MQIDYTRWLSGAVTKNSINSKMTVSQEPLVEIDPTLILTLISINLFLILISKLVPLTLELARTLNMFIRLQVMLLRAI